MSRLRKLSILIGLNVGLAVGVVLTDAWVSVALNIAYFVALTGFFLASFNYARELDRRDKGAKR